MNNSDSCAQSPKTQPTLFIISTQYIFISFGYVVRCLWKQKPPTKEFLKLKSCSKKQVVTLIQLYGHMRISL